MHTRPEIDHAALKTAAHRHAAYVALSLEHGLSEKDLASSRSAAEEHLLTLLPEGHTLESTEEAAIAASLERGVLLERHPKEAQEIVRAACESGRVGTTADLTDAERTLLEEELIAHAKVHHAALKALDVIEMQHHDALLVSALRGFGRTMAEHRARGGTEDTDPPPGETI
jgi:hypothetical protein